MRFPEKITTYGGPKDPFVKIVETFRIVGDVVVAERSVLTKAAAERIVLDVKIGGEGYVADEGSTRVWDEAEERPNDCDPRVKRFHVARSEWVYHPGTWPERAYHEGLEGFCLGSPSRFRLHEYRDGTCRWCPRKKP